ncbi:hypothetical protein N9L68_01585 [bacterium]|nr:hypothetical protein [bacterium]
MEFVAKLHEKQIEGRRVLIDENPAHAKSWALPCIKMMLRRFDVDVVEADQCMYGLKTRGISKAHLVLAKKPTKFMTNSMSIGQALRRKCDGSHTHQPLVDGRAKDALVFGPEL